MYLAKRVGRWSLLQIGRFYNGRHYTTVLHAIEKIENLRKTDEAVDALVDVLTAALSSESTCETPKPAGTPSRPLLIEAIVACDRPACGAAAGQCTENCTYRRLTHGAEAAPGHSSSVFTVGRVPVLACSWRSFGQQHDVEVAPTNTPTDNSRNSYNETVSESLPCEGVQTEVRIFCEKQATTGKQGSEEGFSICSDKPNASASMPKRCQYWFSG